MRLPQKSKNLQKKWKFFHKNELFHSFSGRATFAVMAGKNKKAERDNLLNCNVFKVAPQLSLGFCSLKPIIGGSNAPFLCRDPSKKFEQENFVPSPRTAMLAYKSEQWKRILHHQSATATSSAISTRRSSTDLFLFPMVPCSQ